MNNRPILSICIPTYNRACILGNVIAHYVSCEEFDDNVELVISDNASTDETETICQDYCRKYTNIRYYRNEENMHDENFVRVLDLGCGEYLKLFNDWVYCTNDSLAYMKAKIKENVSERPALFFTSNHLYTSYKAEEIRGRGLDDYVKIVSTFVTYNNLFGAWRDQWHQLSNKNRYASLQLQQQDWSYQLVAARGDCVIYDKQVFWTSDVPLGRRGGYNWFKIHLDNYNKIMLPYVQSGQISNDVYRQDKKNLLWYFKYELGLALFYNYSEYWRFNTKGTFGLLWKYYKTEPFFYTFLLYVFPYYFYRRLRNCIR